MDTDKIFWFVTWVALAPLVALSWVGWLFKQPLAFAAKKINKFCSPWG